MLSSEGGVRLPAAGRDPEHHDAGWDDVLARYVAATATSRRPSARTSSSRRHFGSRSERPCTGKRNLVVEPLAVAFDVLKPALFGGGDRLRLGL
jgi:hypothetical protein